MTDDWLTTEKRKRGKWPPANQRADFFPLSLSLSLSLWFPLPLSSSPFLTSLDRHPKKPPRNIDMTYLAYWLNHWPSVFISTVGNDFWWYNDMIHHMGCSYVTHNEVIMENERRESWKLLCYFFVLFVSPSRPFYLSFFFLCLLLFLSFLSFLLSSSSSSSFLSFGSAEIQCAHFPFSSSSSSSSLSLSLFHSLSFSFILFPLVLVISQNKSQAKWKIS